MTEALKSAGSRSRRIPRRKLLIVARHDANAGGPRLPGIRKTYEQMPEPKRLPVLEGSADAQFLFQTDQAGRVMNAIVRFLSER